MEDFLNRTTTYFSERVAPWLLGRRATIDPARRAELERQAHHEIQLLISRGRPGPEEWRPGAPATQHRRPAEVGLPAALRPVAVRISLPLPPTPAGRSRAAAPAANT